MADFILMLLGCYEQATRDIGGPGSSGGPIASRRGGRQGKQKAVVTAVEARCS